VTTGRQKDDVLTLEFTVLGIPCLGLNGGPMFKHSEAFFLPLPRTIKEETDRTGRRSSAMAVQEVRVVLVQGPLGPFLADTPRAR